VETSDSKLGTSDSKLGTRQKVIKKCECDFWKLAISKIEKKTFLALATNKSKTIWKQKRFKKTKTLITSNIPFCTIPYCQIEIQ